MALVKYVGLAPCAGATVSVFDHGTLDLVTLFQEIDGVTPLVNPFTADSRTGAFRFVAEEGDYDIQIRTEMIAPSLRVPDAELYVIFQGTSPLRRASLVVDDAGTGEQIVISERVY